jgi:hypothetical protein
MDTEQDLVPASDPQPFLVPEIKKAGFERKNGMLEGEV